MTELRVDPIEIDIRRPTALGLEFPAIDRPRIEKLMAAVEWTIPAWRLIILATTLTAYADVMDIRLLAAISIGAILSVVHWIAIRRGKGLLTHGSAGLLIDLLHSTIVWVGVSLAFPYRTYLASPRMIPMGGYLAPLMVIWVIRCFMLNESSQSARTRRLSAVLIAAAQFLTNFPIFLALALANGYPLAEIPMLNIIGTIGFTTGASRRPGSKT